MEISKTSKIKKLNSSNLHILSNLYGYRVWDVDDKLIWLKWKEENDKLK